MRGLLALALVQVLLGAVLAVVGPDEDGVSVEDPAGSTTTQPPGQPPGPGEAPGTPGDGTPPAVPGMPPPSDESPAPTIPPTASAGPEDPAEGSSDTLEIHSSYEELTPAEQRAVSSPPPYRPVVEGRVSTGSYWRISAHTSDGQICFDFRAGQDSEGHRVSEQCNPVDHWEILWLSDGELATFAGYATVEVKEFELLMSDGRSGRVPAAFSEHEGAAFFAAWIQCGSPDIDRIRALDDQGRERSRLRFPPGEPAEVCGGAR